MNPLPETRGNALAAAGSVALALVISVFLLWLTYGRGELDGAPTWVAGLPALAACANAACALALVAGFAAIRLRRPDIHRNTMLVAVGFSAVFFVAYVVRHAFAGDTPYTGTGLLRGLYVAILITHVLGSMGVLVLLPISLRFALIRAFERHKRVNRVLLPLWLYVSVTGVVVFWMLR